MSNLVRKVFCAAAMAGILLLFAPDARATAPVDIQMLPPTDFGTTTACSTLGVLFWNGASTADGIHCVPNVQGDANGNLTFINPSTSGTVKNHLYFGATDVAPTVINLANLGGCLSNQVLTSGGNGIFSCTAVANIPNLGTTTIPTCAVGQQLTFDSTNGFSCITTDIPWLDMWRPSVDSAIVKLTPPVCNGTNTLQFDGNSYSCVATPGQISFSGQYSYRNTGNTGVDIGFHSMCFMVTSWLGGGDCDNDCEYNMQVNQSGDGHWHVVASSTGGQATASARCMDILSPGMCAWGNSLYPNGWTWSENSGNPTVNIDACITETYPTYTGYVCNNGTVSSTGTWDGPPDPNTATNSCSNPFDGGGGGG